MIKLLIWLGITVLLIILAGPIGLIIGIGIGILMIIGSLTEAIGEALSGLFELRSNKDCPACGERIKRKATVCKYCRTDLSTVENE